MIQPLYKRKCASCEGEALPITKREAEAFLKELTGWSLNDTATKIYKIFRFKNFYQTMSFVNAVAWIAHQENHHPYLKVNYNYCEVYLTTHRIKGLSENDFISASKFDQLV